MSVCVANLLDSEDLGITVVEGSAMVARLRRPLAWAHSSDLEDPTPWLVPDGLLLTDGVGFLEHAAPAEVDSYVARLADAGVVALGFAVGVAHASIPPALVEACRTRGMPLLEVPTATPFMGIIRRVSDGLARAERERLEWSVDAQRRIAAAALRPDGLSAILAELERTLGTWVALYDATGERIRVDGRTPVSDHALTPVTEAARSLLSKGRTAAMRLDQPHGGAALQTLGRTSQLRGVLAVGGAAPRDPAGTGVVSSVIALASIALEQSRSFEEARRSLRAGILELLAAGALEAASSTAAALDAALPAAPYRVVIAGGPHLSRAALEELEVVAARHPGRVFLAEQPGRVTLLLRDGDEDLAAAVIEGHRLTCGVSAPVGATDVARGLDEAERAWARATVDRPLERFDLLATRGVVEFLQSAGGDAVARRVLEPLLEDDAGRELLRTTAVWLAHLGQWDPAARALGIHRQTVRARVAAAGEAVGLDLDRFGDRAELWAMLDLLGLTPPASER